MSAEAALPPRPVLGAPRAGALPPRRREVLPSGMRTALVQRGTVPVVALRLVVEVGSAHLAPGQAFLKIQIDIRTATGLRTNAPDPGGEIVIRPATGHFEQLLELRIGSLRGVLRYALARPQRDSFLAQQHRRSATTRALVLWVAGATWPGAKAEAAAARDEHDSFIAGDFDVVLQSGQTLRLSRSYRDRLLP